MSKGKTLYMGTTEVPAIKTCHEIEALLVMAGASLVQKRFCADGSVSAIDFVLTSPQGELGIRLPVRVEGVERILRKARRGHINQAAAKAIREQAERTAWRHVLRWVEAQLAMIETEQALMQQVFLPYAVAADGRTVYDVIQERKILALPPAPGAEVPA